MQFKTVSKKLFLSAFAVLSSAVLLHCTHEEVLPKVSLFQADRPLMPAGFTYADTVIPNIRVNLKYSGYDNFVGRPLAGYRGKRAILRTEAAQALKEAAEDFAKRGYDIIIYDAYRPHTAMQDIGDWGKDLSDQKMRSRYYPHITKSQIFSDKYTNDFSEHSRGVAVDISLISRKTGKEIDMGGYHDYLDPSSATAYPALTPRQRKNRALLCNVMQAHGFKNYEAEWWHYLLRNEPDKRSLHLFPIWDGMKESPRPNNGTTKRKTAISSRTTASQRNTSH